MDPINSTALNKKKVAVWRVIMANKTFTMIVLERRPRDKQLKIKQLQ